jgi:hypothetical protein
MNEIEKTIAELEHSAPTGNTGIAMVRIDEVENLDKSAIASKLRDPKENSYFTSELFSMLSDEKTKLINEVRTYLDNPIHITPKECYLKLMRLKLQMERLQLVINPKVSKVNFTSKGQKYDMGKILWLDDEGQKIRLSRTYGSTAEKGFLAPLLKFIEDNLTTDDIILNYNFHGFEFDLLIKVDKIPYGIDIKNSQRNHFIDNSARVELWGLYKKSYL